MKTVHNQRRSIKGVIDRRANLFLLTDNHDDEPRWDGSKEEEEQQQATRTALFDAFLIVHSPVIPPPSPLPSR